MVGWDWNAMYLTCFGVGLVLGAASFFAGGLQRKTGHLPLGHGGLRGHWKTGGVSPLNGFTLAAFLCWFGGTGYLLHRGDIFDVSLVLLFAVVSGLAGASLLLWFLAKVLMPGERTLEVSNTEIVGVTGRLSATLPRQGVGEMLYSQNGARRSASVRAESGEAIERNAEVIVMRFERGIAYVRRWDEFEHGLLVGGPGRAESEGER
jgi:membrane protein implicated in regulation of membrane protease activity